MKQIIAYIRPNRLTAVSLALRKLAEAPGMSFSPVRGFGSDRVQNAHPTLVRDFVDYAPYVRVEVFCPPSGRLRFDTPSKAPRGPARTATA